MQQSQYNLYVQEILLINHLDLLHQHLHIILKTPEFYYIELPYLFFGASPIGRRKVFLGDILQLWQHSAHWHNVATTRLELIDGWSRGRKQEQPNPQGFYVLNSVGSALSGSNHTLGWDKEKQKMIHIMLPSMFVLLKELEAIYPSRPLKPSSIAAHNVCLIELIHNLKN